MAKISSYPKDLAILNNDAWIGTDSSNRSTKQFTAQAVANYLNINAKILIGGQMWYKFVTTTAVTGTLTGPADKDLFSSITSIDQLSPNNIYSITSFNRDGDANETFTQATPSSSWSVTHTLNKNPAVSVVIGTEVAGGNPTTDDIEVYPQITYTSNSALTIDFAANQVGYAYLN